MTVDESKGSERTWLDELLADMGQRAEVILAEFMEQDPASIDIADRVPYLPGMVLDALAAMKDQLSEKSRVAIEEWEEDNRQRHRRMWEASEKSYAVFLESLPPNWHSPELEFPPIEELEELQLAEGLPLAWLPPNHVLDAMLKLATKEERSKLFEDEATAILDACTVELERLSVDLTKEWRISASEAVQAMKGEHWRAGQALAAIALDTAVVEFIVNGGYSNATTQANRDGPTPPGTLPKSLPTWNDIDYSRALLVMHGIWGSFKQFWVKRGEEVPSQFTRHGTVHSMSPRQYTKANALIAVMHLIGLLCLLDEMISEWENEQSDNK